jgi:hypothetical protein
MTLLRLNAAALALALAAPCPIAFADEDQQLAWTRLQGECDRWMEAGKYREAQAACQRAAGLGQTLEPGLFMDTSLYQLALAYLRQDRYRETEATLRRLLEAREAEFGPEHPLTASGLNLLAAVYRKQGKIADAQPVEARFRAIQEGCGKQLEDESKEQIAAGAAADPCNPVPLPDFMR